MGLTTPNKKIFCTSHKTSINEATHLQLENLHYFRETKKILGKKRIVKGNVILKLKKKMQPVHTPYYHKVHSKQLPTTAVPVLTNTAVATGYSYQQDFNFPLTLNDWHPMHTPLLTVHTVPVIIPTSSPILATHLTPIVGTVVQSVLSPILQQTFVHEDVVNISNYTNEFNYSTEQIEGITDLVNEQSYYVQDIISLTDKFVNTDTTDTNIQGLSIHGDPIESYLNLPKELFPTPKMLALDPNPLIDEFCKMPNLQRHVPWLLDLEFGIPKSPITRPIPTYNVKFNSIHCKNAPDAIHPGFESCDPDFKKVLLFYYDCIVSAWYRGYMIMHCDRSVENFQSWLLLPMQVLGMCWP